MADSYSKWVMTTAFANNLQASINSGNKIEWVSIKTSDDTHLFADLAGFNDTTLVTASIKQTATINAVSINGNTVTITALFNNQNNQADYYIKTLFLVARYNGTEFLAGATVANSASTAFRMPAASATEITEFTARPQITVSNSSTISATVDPVAAATNKRVDGLEATLQGEIDDINADKQSLWDTLVNYVTKAGTDTITGVKTFTQTIVGSITGNAGTATKIQTPRKIAGVSFDGTRDIDLAGVNKIGNQDTTGNAATADVLNIRSATFTDIGVVTSDMVTYSGNWVVNSSNINGIPSIGYVVMEVLPSSGNKTAGIIRISSTSGGVIANYIGLVRDGAQLSWVLLPDDSTVVHNSGNEIIAGVKTFSDWPVVNGLKVSNGTNTSLIVRTNTSIPNQSDNNVPMAINTGSTLAVGGGEAAYSYLMAMAAGAVPIGSADGANEQLVLVGDAAVYIGAGYQSGGTTGKWWAFNTDGTITSPNGNLMQEVNDGSIKIYGLGTNFTTDTYLTLTYSGKVVSIQGELKTTADMSGGTGIGENLIPAGYRPVSTRTKQVGFNSNGAGTKVYADVYFNPNGMITLDNIVNGSNMNAYGTIPAGSLLNISDTWVIA